MGGLEKNPKITIRQLRVMPYTREDCIEDVQLSSLIGYYFFLHGWVVDVNVEIAMIPRPKVKQ